MNKIKYGDVLFAVLMGAALLALFLAFQYRQKFGANTRLPAATGVRPVPPSATGSELIKSAPAGGAGLNKKKAGLKPKAKKTKRVSRLQDPGEALIGGASSETARETPAVPAGNK